MAEPPSRCGLDTEPRWILISSLKSHLTVKRSRRPFRLSRGPQPSESLKALVYFSDGDLRTLSMDEKTTLVKAVSAVRELPEVAIVSRQLTRTG